MTGGSHLTHVKKPSLVPSEVRFLRILYCNCAGMRASRMIPLSSDSTKREKQLRNLADKAHGMALNKAAMCLVSWGDVPAPGSGVGPVGDVRLVADLSTIKQLPWHPSHAMVQASMYNLEGGPWEMDARSTLQRVLKAAAEKGLSVRAGFEIEFVLYTQEGEPLDSRNYCSSSALDAAADVLDDMCMSLEKLGIEVEQVHKEAGPGQFEIALGHWWALEACDLLVLARETIVAVAHRQKLRASFLPKYRANEAGNGLHVHLSVWRDGQNLLKCEQGPEGMDLQDLGFDPTFRSFLAGVYRHLAAVMVFATPTPNSVRRLVPGAWAGAHWIWGVGNKEAPLRLPVHHAEDGTFTNFEVKMLDGTANTYAAVAAIIAAGLAGVAESAQLPPPVQVDPGALSAQEQAEQGVRTLPSSFSAAKQHLMSAEAELLRSILGEELITASVAVRESEWEKLATMPLEEEVELLFDRY